VFSLVAHKQLKEKKSEAIKGTCTVNYMADGIQAMEKKQGAVCSGQWPRELPNFNRRHQLAVLSTSVHHSLRHAQRI
jgi:hypothetical protein